MAANLGPVPHGWRTIGRDQLEALLVTTPHSRVRHMQRRQAENVEDYLHIGGPDLPNAVAAARLGVRERTVEVYRAIIRKALS